ncbi:MAG: TetR/AcrR family transcriptional regulator [Synergistaceae bacterium]|nr:TetR/AcrR family transcriptional regulator [Synergistaceae bacterium]
MNDKEELIHAAIEEIKIHSMRFTMEDLTRRLRVSKTSLYKFVASKDELVSEIVSELIASFNREESEILNSSKPIQKKLQLFTQSFMRITQGFDSRVYGDLQRFYKDEWEKWSAFRQEKISVFMKLLQEGIDSGAVKPVNFAVVYQCLNAAMEAIAKPDFLESNNLTYSQAVDTLQDIVFHGLLA